LQISPKLIADMGTSSIQDYLFRRIRERLEADASLADVVGELLNVSPDSAYRRIRGETPIVLEEAKILCDHFHIPLDGLLQWKEQSVSFLITQLDNTDQGFDSYLESIYQNLQLLSGFRQKEIIYLTKDLAFFHNFCFRPLFAFHYFFWMKSMIQHPSFENRKFSMDVLPSKTERTGNQILQLYNSIPSTEIWNSECVNSIVSQIEYYREAGLFESEDDIALVYKALRDTIDHLRAQAEKGCKFLPGENPDMKKNNFSFFHNRMVLGDNTIMALYEGRKAVYLNYEVLNFMVTQDEPFCNSTYEKLRALMKSATILSNVSEKQRNMFFNSLLRKMPAINLSNTSTT
jgi:hypothetical protein